MSLTGGDIASTPPFSVKAIGHSSRRGRHQYISDEGVLVFLRPILGKRHTIPMVIRPIYIPVNIRRRRRCRRISTKVRMEDKGARRRIGKARHKSQDSVLLSRGRGDRLICPLGPLVHRLEAEAAARVATTDVEDIAGEEGPLIMQMVGGEQ